jgi:hypothetical protein
MALVFCGLLAVIALVAPAVRGRPLWSWVHACLDPGPAGPALMVGRVTVIVLAVIVLIRAHRLPAAGIPRAAAAAGPEDGGGEGG